MAQVNVTVNVDQAALRAWIETEVAGGVLAAAGRVRDQAKAVITAAGRVDTGQMRNAIVAEVNRTEGNAVVGRVTAESEHAAYQHEGTPAEIVPRRAKVLRFRPRGSSTFVFAPSVRGIHPANPTKPLPFLTMALDRLTPGDFTG